MALTDTDRKVLAFLSKGRTRAAKVGAECFAPPRLTSTRQLNHYTVVAGGHLRRLEKLGMVQRVTTGMKPNEKVEWELAPPQEKDLFDP